MAESEVIENGLEKFLMKSVPIFGAVCAAVLLVGAPIAGHIDRRHRKETKSLFMQTYSNHMDIARNLISAKKGISVPVNYDFSHEDMKYLIHLQINLDVPCGAWYNQSSLR
jgi:hypothetical protein